MTQTCTPKWLDWARELQAIGQTGLAFTGSPYDTQRYRRVGELAAEIIATHTTLPKSEIVQSFSAQPGYATAKVDVRGAVVRDGRILLVQERRDQRWYVQATSRDLPCPPHGSRQR